MPRSFDISTDYAESVDAVLQALSDKQYWLARLAESGADASTLDSMTVGDNGIDVVSTQVLRADRMPAVITQFHSGDLRIRREECWTPVVDGSATASVNGSILDSPASLTGSAALEPQPDGGARLKLRATVTVRIPLVGGKLEKFIGSQLVELLIREQRFTTRWIGNTV